MITLVILIVIVVIIAIGVGIHQSAIAHQDAEKALEEINNEQSIEPEDSGVISLEVEKACEFIRVGDYKFNSDYVSYGGKCSYDFAFRENLCVKLIKADKHDFDFAYFRKNGEHKKNVLLGNFDWIIIKNTEQKRGFVN